MTKNIDELMSAMPFSKRYRWCNSGLCGCMGCANNSGGLAREGVTREQWVRWIETHRQPVTTTMGAGKGERAEIVGVNEIGDILIQYSNGAVTRQSPYNLVPYEDKK